MIEFICPVCHSGLELQGNTFRCKNLHSYDRAKSGYINLLMSQKVKEKRHGDDKLMVLARKRFLEAGYYNILLDKILEVAGKYTKNGDVILDAGCGEGWYTDNVFRHLKGTIKFTLLGIDISKNAVDAAAKRNKDITTAVASIFNIPLKENSCDIVLSVFAPTSPDEFKRILKGDGILIKIIPLEKHLWSLKKAVYEHPYENTAENTGVEGFKIIEKCELRQSIHVSGNEEIRNLFLMTPYYYKTGEHDQKKLELIESLDTEVEFGILVYRKLG